MEADEVERVFFRELIEVDLGDASPGGGQARGDEEADAAFTGKERELIGREKRGW